MLLYNTLERITCILHLTTLATKNISYLYIKILRQISLFLQLILDHRIFHQEIRHFRISQEIF